MGYNSIWSLWQPCELDATYWYYSHFMDQETKNQNYEATCLPMVQKQ